MKEKQPQAFDFKKTAIRLGLAGLIWQAVQIEGGKSVNEPNVNIPLEYAVGKAKFSFFDWYKENITRQVINSLTPKAEASGNDGSFVVEEYFSERNLELEPLVEDIIPNQLMQVLQQEGLYFPVNFRFGRPVTLFVSPRKELKITRQDVLRFDIAISEQDELKRKLEYSAGRRTDFSAAVIENGGMGLPLYPVVSRNMGLNDTYIAVAHEGAHTYLLGTEMGFRYALQVVGKVDQPPIVASFNEALAEIIAEEVAGKAVNQFHSKDKETLIFPQAPAKLKKALPDLNKEIRDTAFIVKALLRAGDIEGAEEFMNRKYEELAKIGFPERELDQPTLAFYSRYLSETLEERSADVQVNASLDQKLQAAYAIGEKLRQKRQRSRSLKEFLAEVTRWDLADVQKVAESELRP